MDEETDAALMREAHWQSGQRLDAERWRVLQQAAELAAKEKLLDELLRLTGLDEYIAKRIHEALRDLMITIRSMGGE